MNLLKWMTKQTSPRVAVDLEDKALMISSTQQMITTATPYEELMVRITEENNSPAVLEKNLKRDIFREIMSMYFYLRLKFNVMEHRPITIEEFEVIQKVIVDLAKRVNSLSEAHNYAQRFIKYRFFEDLYSMIITGLERGFIRSCPFFHPDINYYYFFDPESVTVAGYIADDRYTLVFPPNIIELMNEIYAKRYPDLTETTPRQ